MIRTFALALALTMILMVSGASAQAAPIVFKIATVETDETSTSQAFRDFKKFVEEKTDGRVEVQYFANGVLGGEREIIEGVSLGTIQLAFPAASVLSMYGDKFNIFELPFIYNSFDVAYAVWDGEVGDLYSKWMEEQGLLNLGYVAYTARGFANNVRAVRTPEDMKGLKIRVIESQLYIDLFKAFGANPTPMSETEIYTGLQQGTIQGLDQGPFQVYQMKYYEQIKYYTWLKHVIMPVPFIANKKYIEGLPEDIRAVVLEGLAIAKETLRKQLYEDEQTSLESLKKAGIEVIPQLTAEETARFRALLEPIYANYRKIVGDELFDKMLSYNDK